LIDELLHLKAVGLFVGLVLTAVGLPIPEEVLYMLGGFMVYQRTGHLPVVLISCLLGVTAGDNILYWLGRKYGANVLKGRVIGRFIREKQLQSAHEYFSKYGYKMIFIARFIAGLRTAFFLAAGALKLRYWKFAVMDLIGIVIIVPLFISLGYFFGHNIDRLTKDIKLTVHALSVVAIIAFIAYVTYKSYKFFEHGESEAHPEGPDK
jgi:membrane protein DedA with SNARE-associated domain